MVAADSRKAAGIGISSISATQAYGELRQELESRGTPISPLDTQIAAHALALDVCLVSNNTREFKWGTVLKLENWAA